jgi:hypothetical protein
MRIIQLSYERLPKRQARGGGELGTYQTLCALAALGHEVDLVVCGRPMAVESAVRERVREVHWIEPTEPPTLSPAGLASRAFHPDTVKLRFPDAKGYQTRVRDLAQQLETELVWADTIFALSVAPFELPVVYGQYDFLYKLKQVRKDTREHIDLREIARAGNKVRALREAFARPDIMTPGRLREVEIDLCRRASHVQSVSQTEADFLNAEGAHATAIPVVGPTISLPNRTLKPRPGIFLFGNSNTAQKSARMHLWRDLWGELSQVEGVEWHQLGAPPERPDASWHWLERAFDQVHGYVDDLAQALGYGDICFVPYLHDTGYRAKFTVAAAYGTVNMGYHRTFACAPEFTPGEDCIAASNAHEMADQLRRFAGDTSWRTHLAEASRALYERAFTFESMLDRYELLLRAAMKEHAARAA